MQPGSFSSAFFYSVQTLSTVGFGHLYPATFYGAVITTLEITVGLFSTAVVTGLIFVRFSRPVARLLFSETMVISNVSGKPTLQFRVANLHHQPMVEAEFRLMMIRKERIDDVIQAPVQSQAGYLWSDVHFGHRFVENFSEHDDGTLAVDYGRIHETEPVPGES